MRFHSQPVDLHTFFQLQLRHLQLLPQFSDLLLQPRGIAAPQPARDTPTRQSRIKIIIGLISIPYTYPYQ